MTKVLSQPSSFLLEPLLRSWLIEDVGRGDRSTEGILVGCEDSRGQGIWVAKQSGVVAGIQIAPQIFQIIDPTFCFEPLVGDGSLCSAGQPIANLQGSVQALLTGERVALNLAMRLSGIATLTRQYVEAIADLPTQLVDTRKTTPGLRILEKYAVQVGGGRNHRMGLDDAVMLKDNHIAAAGGIQEAIARVRSVAPYPLTVEVETETLDQVREALQAEADIIMLDNMSVEMMKEAVQQIRDWSDRIKIEASGNITLDTIRSVAETGVDFISTSATITRSPWLDLSMKLHGC